MPVSDTWETARQACLKQVFGGPLSPEEGEEVRRFLATEEGQSHLRRNEEMRLQLKEIVDIRPRPVEAAEMTRRFEAMIREKARTALRMTWTGAVGCGLVSALGLAAALQGGAWTYRGAFLCASGAFMGYVLFLLRKKNRELLEDPDMILGMRRDQALARRLRTQVNGWVFSGLWISGMALCWYLDRGRDGLAEVLVIVALDFLVTPLSIGWARRKDRELWDWWEGKTGDGYNQYGHRDPS